MQISGWIMLTIAWGIIVFLCVYCFYRLFKEKIK
jgi:glycerol uptake facilitator-like aquaporin